MRQEEAVDFNYFAVFCTVQEGCEKLGFYDISLWHTPVALTGSDYWEYEHVIALLQTQPEPDQRLSLVLLETGFGKPIIQVVYIQV